MKSQDDIITEKLKKKVTGILMKVDKNKAQSEMKESRTILKRKRVVIKHT